MDSVREEGTFASQPRCLESGVSVLVLADTQENQVSFPPRSPPLGLGQEKNHSKMQRVNAVHRRRERKRTDRSESAFQTHSQLDPSTDLGSVHNRSSTGTRPAKQSFQLGNPEKKHPGPQRKPPRLVSPSKSEASS
ncbi:hypothetical protein E5288_WYG008552 [Bos mutus]|uniref:Uncharacterized protein n=1 Tax=Bos mutus TaxID=72004 RepID=A0A6B0RZA6_9CETA|nr:hypothetical protein [Bos mutus]